MSKQALVIIAYAAAVLFFALEVFTVDVGDLNLTAAGLLSAAAGWLISALP
jgi:hypothetical protein